MHRTALTGGALGGHLALLLLRLWRRWHLLLLRLL